MTTSSGTSAHSNTASPMAPPSGVQRRSVATGLACSVPAVVLATAAPAAAVSCAECADPGKWGYRFRFQATNPSNRTIYLCNITFVTSPAAAPELTWLDTEGTPDGCVTIPPNSNAIINIFVGSSTNSSNLTFSGVMTAPWGHTCPCSNDTDGHMPIPSPFTVLATGPQNCAC